MIHRFIDSIRHIGPTSGFEHYLTNVQRDVHAGNVTAEEAKKDYQIALKIRNRYFLG